MTPDLLYLLDTSIVVEVFRDNSIIVEQLGSKRFLLSSTVLGELQYGARNSSDPVREQQRLKLFTERVPIIPCDKTTAVHYGTIKAILRVKGKLIPENDIWIAAVAIQHGLILATRDKHFFGS